MNIPISGQQKFAQEADRQREIELKRLEEKKKEAAVPKVTSFRKRKKRSSSSAFSEKAEYNPPVIITETQRRLEENKQDRAKKKKRDQEGQVAVNAVLCSWEKETLVKMANMTGTSITAVIKSLITLLFTIEEEIGQEIYSSIPEEERIKIALTTLGVVPSILKDTVQRKLAREAIYWGRGED